VIDSHLAPKREVDYRHYLSNIPVKWPNLDAQDRDWSRVSQLFFPKSQREFYNEPLLFFDLGPVYSDPVVPQRKKFWERLKNPLDLDLIFPDDQIESVAPELCGIVVHC
jgi:hypothetical protein